MRTRSHVVLEAREYEALVYQIGRRREAEASLRKANKDAVGLLMIALHQLAGERGKRDHSHFARHWISQHRKVDLEGVPIKNGFRPTCPYCGLRQVLHGPLDEAHCERCGKRLNGGGA